MSKYQLVKQHDRVGRMADSLEFTNVAFPRHRFDDELIEELRKFAPSVIEEEGDALIIKHLYIERRMVPLNIYIQEAEGEALEHAVIEYGNALKGSGSSQHFPGRHALEELWCDLATARSFSTITTRSNTSPIAISAKVPTPEKRRRRDVWRNLVFSGATTCSRKPSGRSCWVILAVRKIFMAHHADLLEADFWQQHKERIKAGYVHDVFPYDRSRRFIHLIRKDEQGAESDADVALWRSRLLMCGP